jgi:hypothetical protein
VCKGKPLALDDEQLNIIKTYANPLVPWQRDRYLGTLARELQRRETLGSGNLARIAQSVQKAILNGATARAGKRGRGI